MSGEDDTDPGWVRLAMTDASLVAELLLRLGHSRLNPPHPASPPSELAWTVRQRRTRPPPRNPAEDSKKGGRSSPTTPLSWSGATSSGGGGGSEESPPHLDSATRSKVPIASASTVSATIGGKRPRKKKTLAELREEESLLLKERRDLRQELVTLRLNFEKERSINQSLKRTKIGVRPPVISEQHEQARAPCVPSDCTEQRSGDGGAEVAMRPRSCNISEVKKAESRETLELPDLNLPLEDGGGPNISCAAA
ncbi:uncharacterized protein LOC125313760 [Rhodamnia argentea]|uniref:Uncharacterized protein LOC125313760 n=1 Tax=Rhodamnia argentea TaxID=178133 RepID=A0ABM3GZJ1_9MYRT|nr:uncharacterized protein LOC125313760 [Rhodamnia argentea]